MGANLSFKGWNLPKNFLDALQRGGSFSMSDKTPLHTQKYLWLHIVLLDKDGTELKRIPLPLAITNILFFSVQKGKISNPWDVVNNSQSQLSILCAPLFGFETTGKNNSYMSKLSKPERFELHLPQNTLLMINHVDLKLSIE